VEGFDLVDSVRVDRTHFDYSYTLRVRGDARSYATGTFTVTSTAATSQIMKGGVAVGGVDAGSFVRTNDVFTVRQDRTVPLDTTALKFAFSGSPTGVDPSASDPAAVRIGQVAFLESGGRPLHEGSFPIASENPTAGANLILRANLFGSVANASFALIGASGQTLWQGALAAPNPAELASPRYVAGVTVPAQPFRIRVVAIASNGHTVSWTSAKLFVPPAYSMAIAPAKGVLAQGESVATDIVLTSTTASGFYVIALILPAGFASSAGPWTIALAPGARVDLSTTITAPISGEPFRRYTIGVRAAPSGSPSDAQLTNVRVLIE
jgi:hypothetical protein